MEEQQWQVQGQVTVENQKSFCQPKPGFKNCQNNEQQYAHWTEKAPAILFDLEREYRMYQEDKKTLHKDSKHLGYTKFCNVEGTFSTCFNTKGMLQMIFWDQKEDNVKAFRGCVKWSLTNLAPFSITYFKPVFPRNEWVEFIYEAFVSHILGKSIQQVWYMHNKRAYP